MTKPGSGDSRVPDTSVRNRHWKRVSDSLGPRIRRYVAKAGFDEDEADDVVADVLSGFISFGESVHACPDLWKLTLPFVRHGCARLKRNQRRKVGLADSAASTAPDSNWAEKEAYLAGLGAWVRRQLSLLPPRQARSLRLHVLEERPYEECAVRMQSSEAAVRFNVHRALKRLRALARDSPPPAPPGI